MICESVMATTLQPPADISFSFDPWLKSNLRFGEPDEHVYRNGRLARQGSVVCKHWLKGLCKKGDVCEFLHEYNIRKMPECWFFNKHGYCQNVEECLYRHIDPMTKVGVCPWYERGFCPLGPDCSKRHIKGRRICQNFLTGFCPQGKECLDAQTHGNANAEEAGTACIKGLKCYGYRGVCLDLQLPFARLPDAAVGRIIRETGVTYLQRQLGLMDDRQQYGMLNQARRQGMWSREAFFGTGKNII